MSFDLRGRRRRPFHVARGNAFAQLEVEEQLFALKGRCSAQHDMNVANASGATVRADLNNALVALTTMSSGASAPSTTFSYMLWADTTNKLLKQRNAANIGWLVRGSLNESFVVPKSAGFTVGVLDFNQTFNCTGTFTITLTAATTLGDGFLFHARNNGSGVITIDPNAAETIDGAATITLGPGESVTVWCNGTLFVTVGNRTDGEYRSVQVFTGSGTWNKPAGLKRARVTVIAAGGGGGGAPATGAGQVSAGGGGGAGGAAIKTVAAASLGSSETVTVGAGGTASPGASGGAGGSSSFGAHCSATGGSGGLAAGPASAIGGEGGPGGVGSSGDVNIRGSAGTFGVSRTADFFMGGTGGSSILGGGGLGQSNGVVGDPGGNYGGGGGGSAQTTSSGAQGGGGGAGGIVIVEEFF